MSHEKLPDWVSAKLGATITTLGWLLGNVYHHADLWIERLTNFVGLIAAIGGAILVWWTVWSKYKNSRNENKE